MKLLTNPNGSYLTGNDIADAVMQYNLALTKTQDVDLVDIPFIAPDRVIRRVELIIGWLNQVTAVSHTEPHDELLEVDTILSLYAKTHAASVHGEPFTDEQMRQNQWPLFDSEEF
jgi:hypothetical protein